MVVCLYGNRETGEQEETDEFQQKLIWARLKGVFSVTCDKGCGCNDCFNLNFR